MICVHTLHISLNRSLLLIVGLWPYQQCKFVRLQLILLLGIVMSYIVFQLTVLVTLKCTADLIISVLSSVLFCTMFLIKYISVDVNNKGVKYLLEEMQHFYNEVTDENEINILDKYSSYAKRYTITFLLFGMAALFGLILCSFCPHIIYFLISINGTRSRTSLPFITEYFIDQEKYFYLILFHANAAHIIGSIAMLATGTILTVYIHHAYGMFQIASYRIKRAMALNVLTQKNSTKKENSIKKSLICAVDVHRKAIKFSEIFVSRFNTTLFFLIIVGLISTTLNLFRIFQVVSLEHDVIEFFYRLLYIIVHCLYTLLANYFGQEITNHNNNVFVNVYNVQWYIAPLQVQKMILFLLQRGTKGFNMTIAGLFVGSLEGAATLFSTAVSYMTVLYSTRK